MNSCSTAEKRYPDTARTKTIFEISYFYVELREEFNLQQAIPGLYMKFKNFSAVLVTEFLYNSQSADSVSGEL